MNPLKILIFLALLLPFIVACVQGPSDLWFRYGSEYKRLATDSGTLRSIGIESVYKDRITTISGNYIGYAKIKMVYPKESDLIYRLINQMKKIDGEMLIGEDYTAILVQPGGSKYLWMVNVTGSAGLNNFNTDIHKFYFGIYQSYQVDTGWYEVITTMTTTQSTR